MFFIEWLIIMHLDTSLIVWDCQDTQLTLNTNWGVLKDPQFCCENYETDCCREFCILHKFTKQKCEEMGSWADKSQLTLQWTDRKLFPFWTGTQFQTMVLVSLSTFKATFWEIFSDSLMQDPGGRYLATKMQGSPLLKKALGTTSMNI